MFTSRMVMRWPSVAARQREQPVQPARCRRGGSSDRSALGPAPSGLRPPRYRAWHPRGGRAHRPLPANVETLPPGQRGTSLRAPHAEVGVEGRRVIMMTRVSTARWCSWIRPTRTGCASRSLIVSRPARPIGMTWVRWVRWDLGTSAGHGCPGWVVPDRDTSLSGTACPASRLLARPMGGVRCANRRARTTSPGTLSARQSSVDAGGHGVVGSNPAVPTGISAAQRA
jgi:hypothetical protein